MGAHSPARPVRYTPVMVLGAVAAAFFAQSGGDTVALSTQTVAPTAAFWCRADAGTPAAGSDDAGCVADGTGSRAVLYWDRSAAPEDAAIGVSAEGGSTVSGNVEGRSGLAMRAADSSSVTARSSGGSIVEGAVDYFSSLDADGSGGSTIRTIVGNASAADLVATDASTVEAFVDENSSLAVRASGGSDVSTMVTNGSVAVIDASGGSLVVAGVDLVSVLDVDAKNSVVRAVVENYSTTTVVAHGGSVVETGGDESAQTLNAYENAVILSSATDGALTNAAAANGGRIAVNSVAGTVAALADAGTVQVQVLGGSVNALALGAAATTAIDVENGASVSALTQGSATAFIQASGSTVVSADAVGGGATVGVSAYADVDQESSNVTALSYDGAEVSVIAGMRANDSVIAAAAGAGSRAIVIVDNIEGTDTVVVTVLALDGGTGYYDSTAGIFGCVGGVTEVRTAIGSCTSNGNRTVVTYADGTTAEFFDLVVPDGLETLSVDPADLPPIEPSSSSIDARTSSDRSTADASLLAKAEAPVDAEAAVAEPISTIDDAGDSQSTPAESTPEAPAATTENETPAASDDETVIESGTEEASESDVDEPAESDAEETTTASPAVAEDGETGSADDE